MVARDLATKLVRVRNCTQSMANRSMHNGSWALSDTLRIRIVCWETGRTWTTKFQSTKKLVDCCWTTWIEWCRIRWTKSIMWRPTMNILKGYSQAFILIRRKSSSKIINRYLKSFTLHFISLHTFEIRTAGAYYRLRLAKVILMGQNTGSDAGINSNEELLNKTTTETPTNTTVTANTNGFVSTSTKSTTLATTEPTTPITTAQSRRTRATFHIAAQPSTTTTTKTAPNTLSQAQHETSLGVVVAQLHSEYFWFFVAAVGGFVCVVFIACFWKNPTSTSSNTTTTTHGSTSYTPQLCFCCVTTAGN